MEHFAPDFTESIQKLNPNIDQPQFVDSSHSGRGSSMSGRNLGSNLETYDENISSTRVRSEKS
jgi:hypothetical protein